LNGRKGAKAEAREGKRRILFAAIPAVLTVVLDVLWRMNSGFVEYSILMFLFDFIIVLGTALVILSLQKRLAVGAAAVTGLALYLYAVAWAKYDILGEAPKYNDIALIREFYYFYGPWAFAAIAAPAVVLVGLLAWNFRFDGKMLVFGVLPVVFLFQVGPYGIRALDLNRVDGSGHHYYPLPLKLGQYGAFLRSAIDHKVRKLELLEIAEIAESAGAVIEDADLFIDRPLEAEPRRSVHVLLIESLVDPANLDRFT